MKPPQPSWEQLNAYVDGEVDGAEKADIAAAAAKNPAVARQVAALTRLKAAAAETLEPYSGPLPAMAPNRKRSWPMIAIAAAASVALFIVAAALTLGDGSRDDDLAWITPLADTFTRTLAEESTTPRSQGDAGTLLVALSRLGPDAYVPDLTSAKLRIREVRVSDGLGKEPAGLQVIYAGERGCRIGLWIVPAPPGLDDRLAVGRSGPYASYSWRVGELGYVLLSAMEPARFRLIAETAHRLTIENRAIDGTMSAALAQSRAKSPPCTA